MMASNRPDNGPHWRRRLYIILFEGDRHRLGKLFDEILMVAILASVIVVMLDSVDRVLERYGAWLHAFEWTFTILFTIEYVARLASVQSKRRYAFSFFGIVDLLSIVPTYMSLLMPGAQVLAAIRLLRVLRVFRVLKLVRYLGEADLLGRALAASRRCASPTAKIADRYCDPTSAPCRIPCVGSWPSQKAVRRDA